MNYQTINAAAKLLGVSETRVRRAAKAGEFGTLKLGNRTLVDVDEAKGVLLRMDGVPIAEVSKATGLTVNAIRRAVGEGWMPYTKPGHAFLFNIDEVLEAIKGRAANQNKGK